MLVADALMIEFENAVGVRRKGHVCRGSTSEFNLSCSFNRSLASANGTVDHKCRVVGIKSRRVIVHIANNGQISHPQRQAFRRCSPLPQ